MENVEREVAAIYHLSAASNQEKEQAFRACAETAEHERQIAMYADKIEKELHLSFETAGMKVSDVIDLPQGREFAALVGPKILMTIRDQFWLNQLADLYTVEFGQPLYYLRSHDNPIAVVSASTTDGGAAQATNSLITGAGYDTPVDILPRRLVMSFQYDSPKLAMSQASSRSRALDLSRYKMNKAFQDSIVAAWQACQMATIPASLYYDLPTGRVMPTTNKFAHSVDGLSIASIKDLSRYFATFGWDGQIILFVSDVRFEDTKSWVSTTTITDIGGVYAEQIANGRMSDTAAFGNVLIVKKNNVPDNLGMGIMVSDNGTKTLGAYQFGKMQSLPSPNSTSTRSAFDLVIPGMAGVCHDACRTAFLNF